MSYYHQRRETARRGFTLIELLIVIVIIGILASLLLVGGRAAMQNARRGLIKVEISQVGIALESYQKEYGEYPPDFSDEAAVMRHVRKRWPNFDWQGRPQTFATFCDMVKSQTGYDFAMEEDTHDANIKRSRAAHISALAFWLGGIPDKTTGLLHGFNADVTNPLAVKYGSNKFDPNTITQWDAKSQFMELTIGKNCEIVDDLPVLTAFNLPIVYFKPNAVGKYFQRDTGEILCFHSPFTGEWSVANVGIAVPYAKTDAPEDEAVWHNPKGYQLIHPGLDGKFSGDSPAEFRAIDPAKDVTVGCTSADNDNQANFGGPTIETAGK